MSYFTPPPVPQKQSRGWFGRNWPWLVPTGCLAVLAVVVGFVALIVTSIFGMMRSSDAYQSALATAVSDSEVQAILGVPIKDGFFFTGNIETTGASGKASLQIPISGPKGEATIFADATKAVGHWSFSLLVVEINATHQRIDLKERAQPVATDNPDSASQEIEKSH